MKSEQLAGSQLRSQASSSEQGVALDGFFCRAELAGVMTIRFTFWKISLEAETLQADEGEGGRQSGRGSKLWKLTRA